MERRQLAILLLIVVAIFAAWALFVFAVVHGDCSSIPTVVNLSTSGLHGDATNACAGWW